jgi:hypothetical protein
MSFGEELERVLLQKVRLVQKVGIASLSKASI